MIKTLLAGFITLICVASYASPNTQPNQNTNSSSTTNSSANLDPLLAAGAVQFEQPWARPTTNQTNNSAMYFTLVNTRGSSYNLVNISSDEVGRIEIHQTITDDQGVSKMVKVDYPFLISGNINVDFKPGGMHIMLYDLKRNLDANTNDSLDINFFFDDNSTKIVTVKVATDNPYNTSPSGN